MRQRLTYEVLALIYHHEKYYHNQSDIVQQHSFYSDKAGPQSNKMDVHFVSNFRKQQKYRTIQGTSHISPWMSRVFVLKKTGRKGI
jgi:hypothetical protein